MKKSLIAALVAAATTLGAGAAHAGGNVFWSIGINLPPVGTVISNAPVYGPAPVFVPAPVLVAPPMYVPAPVFYAPPPVVYYRPVTRVVYSAPVYVGRPVPVAYGYAYGGGWGDRDHDGVPNRWDRHDGHGHWDRDHDGVPNRYDRHDGRRH